MLSEADLLSLLVPSPGVLCDGPSSTQHLVPECCFLLRNGLQAHDQYLVICNTQLIPRALPTAAPMASRPAARWRAGNRVRDRSNELSTSFQRVASCCPTMCRSKVKAQTTQQAKCDQVVQGSHASLMTTTLHKLPLAIGQLQDAWGCRPSLAGS